MMKPINTKLHGILDYVFALTLAMPYITEYYGKSEDTWILCLLGGAVAFYSLLTDYEFGIIRWVPMKVHLVLDVIVAIFLILLPWIFPMRHYSFHWPVLLGILSVVIILLSRTVPFLVTRKELDITKP